ncbi:MAG: sugar kinase [Deltaproteobacteria bacterium]|nr:sugar kinase [Deltaproteobacteria bacterium]
MKVAGLGQSSLDYIAFVDRFPEEDTKAEVTDFTVQGGGPVATALVSLSRLGVKTFFSGRVSDDHAGVEIRRGLKAEGVDVRGLKVQKGGSSQLAFILVNRKTGSRTILWQRPTVSPLSPSEVSPSFIKDKDFLLLDGLMMDSSVRAAKTARAAGVPVMLDAGRVRPGMLELAALSDYIVASEEFARGLKLTPLDALKRLSSLNPRAATVTLGARGSVTWAGGKIFRLSAFKVRAVDTTGAGDVFHGGYVYGLLQGWDIQKTVRFASAFAALKCLRPGGREGIPTLKAVLKFMKSAGARVLAYG